MIFESGGGCQMKKILSIIFVVIISLALVTGISTPADVKGASFETSGEIEYSQDSAKVSGIKYYYKDSYFYKDIQNHPMMVLYRQYLYYWHPKDHNDEGIL